MILPFFCWGNVKMKTISIAMATYNGARFITEQLESFVHQTVLPNELVVTDDNSTDNTLEIVAAFAAKAPFSVRYQKNEKQLGFRANFMKAATLCSGDLISFSDQDDVWLPTKLETCVAAFENEKVLLVYHDVIVVNEFLKPMNVRDNQAAPKQINHRHTIDPWRLSMGFTQTFRRVLLSFNEQWNRSVDFRDVTSQEAHDQWFFFLASCLGILVYINEPLALYRQHRNNTYGWNNSLIFQQAWNRFTSGDTKDIAAREISARQRALSLEKSQDKVADDFKINTTKAALGYRKLEMNYRKRRLIYESDAIYSRLRQIMSMIISGGYKPKNQWGAGKRALIRDIIRGIIFPMQIPF